MTVVCSSGVLFGGHANNGAYAGLSFTAYAASGTFARIGSRLY